MFKLLEWFLHCDSYYLALYMEQTLSHYIQNPSLIDELSVGDLETWLSNEPFNVVLHFILSTKMGNLQKDHSDFAIRNTLYPYLLSDISNDHRFQNIQHQSQPLSDIVPDETMESEIQLETLEQNENVVVPKSELQKEEFINPEESTPQEGLNTEILPEIEETMVQNMVESTFSNQIIIPEEPKITKNRKKKKVKKLSGGTVENSSFTEWLLSTKQIGSLQKILKKKKKKDNIHISARKSITPSDDIISESLAKILKTQGHLLEAKKMFKKLIIRHPEHKQKYSKEIEDIIQLMDSKV